jgi:ribonuclease D
VVQLSNGDGNAHLVVFEQDYNAPTLKALLSDPARVKIMHYARFDVAVIFKHLGVMMENIYCTKVASKIARTYTEQHGLKDLCREFLNFNLAKEQQCSYWGTDKLSDAQVKYAAGDVLYLHALRDKLNHIISREQRTELVKACFEFLPTRVLLDLTGWQNVDVFGHDQKK